MRLARIGILVAAVAFTSAAGAITSKADTYPDRTVTLIVPVLPGSVTDVIARIVADQLSQKWKHPVIVNNVSGGGMNIGSERAASSPPDGYTLLVAPPTPFTIADMVYKGLPYDPLKFEPITVLVNVPNVLLARTDLPVNSVQELVTYAKAHPASLTYGSQGVGTTSHLSFKLLEKLTGIEMVHVPYRGEVPILNDLMAGQIDLFFGTMSTSYPLYKAGKLKALAVGSTKRSPFLPEVPTMAEQGLPSFQSIAWHALAGPPGLPSELAEKINKDVTQSLHDPAVSDKIRKLLLEPIGGSLAETAAFLSSERARWRQVIKDAGLQPQNR